jgi:hypothetical protein
MLLAQDDVEITDRDGTLKYYEDFATLSGNPVYRYFCSKDGKYGQASKLVSKCAGTDIYSSPVKSETQAYPGKMVVKMGMFPRIPQPEAEGFGLHRHPWQGKNKDVPVYKLKWAGPEKERLEI